MQDHDDGAYNTQPHETAESTGSTTRDDTAAAHKTKTAGTEIGTGPASSTDVSDGQERTDTSNDSSNSQSVTDGGDLDLCDLPAEDLIGERVVVTSYDGDERPGVLVDVDETTSEHDHRALRVEFDERRTTYFADEGRNDRVRLAEDAAIDENPEPVPDGGRREWRCSECDDSVPVKYPEDGVCVGCKYGGKRPKVTDGGRTSEPVKNLRIAVDGDQLDPTNALHYLVALATEARRHDGHWNGDDEGAAKWAVAQWCQEIGWAPDLRDYEPGQTVEKTDDIQC
jgi:hypothetical protein